ncbi:MAG: acetyl-CoA carboxylase, biotin carboxyl carrier protein [Clostridiales bacterium]|jgi:acetyl/propionyl-CoA carboxylase alpha subunit|nr:acetyl-CoA carboxylase, biotin carboxyl carrier protein [Clostridiales bacterium]
MELTEKIEALSQTMRANGVKLLEIKNGDEEIRIELFSLKEMEVSEVPMRVTRIAEDYITIPAPIMGVGYLAPAEDAEPFTVLGSRIKKGDVLCIIEAMKVMNEIIADYDYEILEVCFKNGQIIEYGQDLFKVKKIEAPNVH